MKSLWIFASLFAAPLAAAQSHQPEYDASLSRIYTYVMLQQTAYASCMGRFPERADYDAAYYAAWKQANEKTIAEVTAHHDAMDEASRNELEAMLEQAKSAFVNLIGKSDTDQARTTCQILSSALTKDTAVLEKKYAKELAALRSCHEDGTCPSLKQ